MTRKLVFLSYARADEPEQPRDGEVRWLTFVLGYLKAAFRGTEVEFFTDRGLVGGADWSADIEHALRACDAFVLLVSPHSMTSTFVVEKEIAIIRAREQAGDAPLFVPLILAPTPEASLDLIRDKNWRPPGDKTLWEFSPPERARSMMEAAQEIAKGVKGRERASVEITDRETLLAWLKGQSREVAVAIAARAALRVLPLYRVRKKDISRLSNLTVALFRATALARVAGKYPTRANELRAAAAEAPAAAAYADADAAWRAVAADIDIVLDTNVAALADSPLWPATSPAWATSAWAAMRARLPPRDGWDVWFDWYEDRLRGVARSETYELTFATVPEEVWQQGAKAANAWIAEHLPKGPAPADLPQPIEGVESPAGFAWDEALRRLIQTEGAVPLFEFDSSADDHAQTLKAARAALKWLLDALRAQSYNVRPSYAARIAALIEALPTSVTKGAILETYNHTLTLREVLIADWDDSPTEFKSDATRVIETIFALSRFYPEVDRHVIGVAKMKDVELLSPVLFPAFARTVTAAADIVDRSVGAGLLRVESLGPGADAPARARTIDRPAEAVIPAPPQTPDAAESASRVRAAWANGFWKALRAAPTYVAGADSFVEHVQKIGAAVKPILEWLARSQGG